MDEKDKEIIDLLQNRFPLSSEPYKDIGDKVWIDEVSVISRLARMFQDGAIRYIGPFFDGNKLGFSSCLAALDTPENNISFVTNIINSYDAVSHNYLRDGTPNIWFTVTAPTLEEQNKILQEIKEKTGVKEIKVFTAKKKFKTCVNPIKGVNHD